MRLTRSLSYALLALGYIAGHPEDQPITAQTIARQHQLPLDYLLKILQQLTRAEILGSIRGAQGGFHLARSADKITLLQIMEALETSRRRPLALRDAVLDLFEQAQAEANRHFGQTTLADLLPK